MKASSYYAKRAKELAKSVKVFVATVWNNSDKYWSFRNEIESTGEGNIYLMEKENVGCDFGYWSSGLDKDGDSTTM